MLAVAVVVVIVMVKVVVVGPLSRWRMRRSIGVGVRSSRSRSKSCGGSGGGGPTDEVHSHGGWLVGYLGEKNEIVGEKGGMGGVGIITNVKGDLEEEGLWGKIRGVFGGVSCC